MKTLLDKIFHTKKTEFERVAEKQLRENKEVIESLRDYDAGKKEISTRKIERRLPNIRIAP